MKISVIEPVGGHGGMNYYDIGLASGFVALGYESTLYTCDETREVSSRGCVIRKNFKDVYGKRNKALRFISYLLGLLKSAIQIRGAGGRFAHVHFFHYGMLELLTCVLLRMFGLTLIATVHDVESFAGGDVRWLQKKVFSMCKKLVVHNQYSKNVLTSVMENGQKVSVIPHGNYRNFVNKIPKADARYALGLKNDEKVILFFGQIKEVKGLDLLLRAFALAASDIDEIVLLIAGKVWKTSFEKFQQLIESCGIESKVISRIEYIPDEDVHLYYSAADLVALPYRQIFQSGVLLMAMSYECPVLVSDLEPMKEVVVDRETGFLFQAGSVEDLAKKLKQALLDNLGSVGDKAGQLMDDCYSWKKVAGLYIEEYKRL